MSKQLSLALFALQVLFVSGSSRPEQKEPHPDLLTIKTAGDFAGTVPAQILQKASQAGAAAVTVPQKSTEEPTDKELEHMWRTFDKDGDGSVSREEFKRGVITSDEIEVTTASKVNSETREAASHVKAKKQHEGTTVLPQTGSSTCADLKNHGTHFTVEIEVGTPGQKFDVVADTGSDALIVTSCACVKAGYCSKDSRCFQGTNRSSTFAITDGPQGPPVVRMMFGSGPVQAVVASDTVRVGELQTKMPNGLLLMTDQLLNIQGDFEGILGLGLPSSNAQKGLYSTNSDEQMPADSQSPMETAEHAAEKIQEAYMGRKPLRGIDEIANDQIVLPTPASIKGGSTAVAKQLADILDGQLVHNLREAAERAADNNAFLGVRPKTGKHKEAQVKIDKKHNKQPQDNATNSSGMLVKGFMEEAGIKRFSMCFNDGKSGVLRLGTPKVHNAHGSVGQVHWGLDFRGISVGNKTAAVKFCTAENMKKGQKTPCGAIPDSGTTAIMAPEDQLITLYESLCDRWDRCKKNHSAMVKAARDATKAAVTDFGHDPWHIEAAPKAAIFQSLVMDCRHWLTKDEGLDELPKIHFHIRGANSTTQTLSLAGWSYIIETQEKQFKYIYKKVPGFGKLPVGKNYTGPAKKVCSPAFSPMQYETKDNGPVWILGTPVFYEYRVGYDLSSKPPSISFSDDRCGTCDHAGDEKMSFMAKTASSGRKHAREPRQVHGPWRMPSWDFTQPL